MNKQRAYRAGFWPSLAGLFALIALVLVIMWFREHHKGAALARQLHNIEGRLDAWVAEQGAQASSAQSCPQASLPLADQTLQQICSAYMAYAQSNDKGIESLISVRLEQDIQQKYAFLFQAITLGKQDAAQLSRLMIERESVLNAPVQGYFTQPEELQAVIDEQQGLLANIDAEVRELLGEQVYHKYELLNDSGFEQYQLEQFSQSLTAENQVTGEQKGQLLLSKLQYQQKFEQQLAQLGEAADAEKVKDALSAFKAAYYSDGAAVLSPVQLVQLKAFEDAQFDALFQSLSLQLMEASSSQPVAE